MLKNPRMSKILFAMNSSISIVYIILVVTFLTNQIIEFGKIFIENSVYFVVKYIFNSMLGPELDSILGHY